MPGDKRSASPEHNVTKRNKLELQGNQAKAIAKGLQDLPPEVIGKIMSYCSTKDKKEMRCVSKWYYNVVSTASKELKLLFEITIKNIDESNYTQISEVLSNAVKRSHGPEVRLDLQFNRASSDQMREILSNFKENIVSLYIPLRKIPEILLQPHLELTNIQRLDIDFPNVDYDLNKNICEAILARYGDKLEHLGVRFLKIHNNTVLQVPHLSLLKSLALGNNINIVNTLVNSVNKENITHLSLCDIRLDIGHLDNFIFPKLQYLETFGKISGESVLALIKCNKDTITKLKVKYVNFRHSDIGDIKIPRLQYLDFYNLSGDVALSLIKCNKDSITKLKLWGGNFRNSDIGDIKIPRLQYLDLYNLSGDVALSLIKCNKDTITKLKLSYVSFIHDDIVDIKTTNLQYLEISSLPGDDALSLIKCNKDSICELRLSIPVFRNTSLPDVEMPRLKRLYLRGGSDTSELEFIRFIKAFGGNIEEFWSYDKQKQTYIRKSREELIKLKTEALALQ